MCLCCITFPLTFRLFFLSREQYLYMHLFIFAHDNLFDNCICTINKKIKQIFLRSKYRKRQTRVTSSSSSDDELQSSGDECCSSGHRPQSKRQRKYGPEIWRNVDEQNVDE